MAPHWLLDLARAPLKGRKLQRVDCNTPSPGWLVLIYNALVDHIEASGGRLRPSGNGGLVGRCPLHHDCNPSFSVHPERGWKCFAGCGEGRLTNLAVRLGISIL